MQPVPVPYWCALACPLRFLPLLQAPEVLHSIMHAGMHPASKASGGFRLGRLRRAGSAMLLLCCCLPGSMSLLHWLAARLVSSLTKEYPRPCRRRVQLWLPDVRVPDLAATPCGCACFPGGGATAALCWASCCQLMTSQPALFQLSSNGCWTDAAGQPVVSALNEAGAACNYVCVLGGSPAGAAPGAERREARIARSRGAAGPRLATICC